MKDEFNYLTLLGTDADKHIRYYITVCARREKTVSRTAKHGSITCVCGKPNWTARAPSVSDKQKAYGKPKQSPVAPLCIPRDCLLKSKILLIEQPSPKRHSTKRKTNHRPHRPRRGYLGVFSIALSCQEIGRKIFSTRHVVLQHTCNLYIFQHGSTVGQSIVGLRRFNSERIEACPLPSRRRY